MNEDDHIVINRKVLTPANTPCSIDGCDNLAEASITIADMTGDSVRYFGCAEHIGLMREAVSIATSAAARKARRRS